MRNPSAAVAVPSTLDVRGIFARHGLTRSAIYRAIRQYGFPSPLKVGTRSYWLTDEIDRWFAERAAEREQPAAPSDLREARRRAGVASGEARRRKREAAQTTSPTPSATTI